MFQINKIKNLDLVLVVTILILVVVGGMNVFATTFYPNKEATSEFYSQMFFYSMGITVGLVVSVFDYRKLRNRYIQFLIFAITVIFLLLVLAIGTTRYGATRWIAFGNFLFQPSELAKVSILILFAYILSVNKGISIAKDSVPFMKRLKTIYRNRRNPQVAMTKISDSILKLVLRKGFIVGFIWLVFAFLIMQQHSLGNTMLLTGIAIIIYIYAHNFSWATITYVFTALAAIILSFGLLEIGVSPGQRYEIQGLSIHLPTAMLLTVLMFIVSNIFRASYIRAFSIFVVLILSSLFLSFSYNNILHPYQRTRIDSFIQVGSEDLDQTSNWNRQQSLIACGSGKVFGKGFTQGTQSNYKFLPFSFTDFAYCGFVEQFGLTGSVILVGVYCTLLYRILKIAEKTRDKFGSYIVVGVFGLILLNMLQHIGMNIGLLPITGVPLPFISYGGTSILIAFIAIGLVQSVSNFSEQRKSVIRPKLKSKVRGKH